MLQFNIFPSIQTEQLDEKIVNSNTSTGKEEQDMSWRRVVRAIEKLWLRHLIKPFLHNNHKMFRDVNRNIQCTVHPTTPDAVDFIANNYSYKFSSASRATLGSTKACAINSM